jgi:hypothetical protein
MKTFLLVLSCIALLISALIIVNLNDTNETLKGILSLEQQVSELSSLGEEYYTQASLDYEDNNFKGVVNNCENARKYFSENSQKLKEIKVRLDTSKQVFNIYSSMLDKNIIIQNSMYESCEHFESASRYYDNDDYDMGEKEINAMNEKIRNHDKAVEEYNLLLAQYYLEIDKITK